MYLLKNLEASSGGHGGNIKKFGLHSVNHIDIFPSTGEPLLSGNELQFCCFILLAKILFETLASIFLSKIDLWAFSNNMVVAKLP
jgi:hypothetical protein